MKSLDELIKHFRDRIPVCRSEAARLSGIDADRWQLAITQWNDEAAIARDTASYLETLKALGEKRKADRVNVENVIGGTKK